MREARVRVRLPVEPLVLRKWVEERVKSPKASTWIKFALLAEYLKGLALNPKHSDPQHFEVSAQRAEGMVSRVRLKDGATIRPLCFLIELGLIKKVSSYRADIAPRPNKYRFKTENFESYEIEVSQRLFERFKRLSGKLPRPSASPLAWIEESLNRLTLTESQIARLKASEGHRVAATRFAKGDRPLIETRGIYLTHCVSGFPKRIRSNLRFDGVANVARLDISGAHPVVLPWLIEDTIKAAAKRKGRGLNDEEKAELAILRARLSEEDFYLGLMPNDKRKAAKKTFLSSLNGAVYPTALEVAKALAEACPISARVIRGRRFKDGRAFSDEHQGRVTTIIKAVAAKCRLAGIPCVPVSDELIVPFRDRLRVLDWLHEEIFDRTGVKALVDEVRGAGGMPSKDD